MSAPSLLAFGIDTALPVVGNGPRAVNAFKAYLFDRQHVFGAVARETCGAWNHAAGLLKMGNT
jgi:hypothetical protein